MAASIRVWENLLLFCCKQRSKSFEDDQIPEVVRQFLQGDYEEILCSTGTFLLSLTVSGSDRNFADLIKSSVEQLVMDSSIAPDDKELKVLTCALSCLQLFVQNNWLGPPTDNPPGKFINSTLSGRLKDFEKEAVNELSVDGEPVYSRSRYLLYLYIARVVLLDCRSFFTQVQTWDWWLMRCLLVQHSLLQERSPTLKATVMELIEELSKKEPLMTDDGKRDVQVLFHIEAGHACHTFLEYKKAYEHFNSGKKIAGLQVKLTGAMGKRTRYQEENKAQLVLQITRESESKASDTATVEAQGTKVLPKILPLDDDTVLNEIKFVDDSVGQTQNLTDVEQVLIIGLMESYRRSVAEERLTTEEVLTYLSSILHEVTNWGVAVVALALRSKLEKDSRRRVERSMMQLEELSKLAGSPASNPSVEYRVPLFYASRVPPIWTIQNELAQLLLSLGLTGEALDTFEKLEMWEDVIACYQKMGKLQKAENVIRERLAIEETPVLLCFLGDVTKDIEDYKKAWELSGHHSARAMRCMGYIHFHHSEFEKAMSCFSTSLELNSLQIPVWFTYGCTAMACQKFDIGVKAFKRCVNIDYDNFEAWGNLATCYVKLKEKHKAFATLQDALKCNYDNWRLWENSLVIGTDCGEFEHVIQSFHRLMDLKEKWVDNEVLGILTRAVTENLPDAHGQPAAKLDGKLLELFGRLTSKVTAEGEVWSNYAKLYSTKVGDREPDSEKALQFLQKAYRCYTQSADWEKDVATCKQVAKEADSLAKIHIKCAESKNPQESIRLLSAAKLMLRGALVKIQKQHTDPMSQVLNHEVVDVCEMLDTTLSELMDKIQHLRDS